MEKDKTITISNSEFREIAATVSAELIDKFEKEDDPLFEIVLTMLFASFCSRLDMIFFGED